MRRLETLPRLSTDDVPWRKGGVYVLWRGDEVAYIGASENVRGRLSSHGCHPRRRNFDAVSVIWCTDSAVRLVLEFLYQCEYRPVENSRIWCPPDSQLIWSRKAERLLGAHMPELVNGYKPLHVAQLLRVSVPTVKRWIRAGKLPARESLGRYRVPRSALDRFAPHPDATLRECGLL